MVGCVFPPIMCLCCHGVAAFLPFTPSEPPTVKTAHASRPMKTDDAPSVGYCGVAEEEVQKEGGWGGRGGGGGQGKDGGRMQQSRKLGGRRRAERKEEEKVKKD